MELRGLGAEEIVELLKSGEAKREDLMASGICPTCFDREHDFVVFGDNEDKIIYEDEYFEVYLISNPRAHGHINIGTKKHFKDMMELDDETCKRAFLLAKKVMIIIREVYGAKSVYLCTMCDGEMNHFHVQLIPRYAEEKIGSSNFVKPRFDYVEDKEKVMELRRRLDYKE